MFIICHRFLPCTLRNMFLENGIQVIISRTCANDTLLFTSMCMQHDLRNAHTLENHHGIYHLLEHMYLVKSPAIDGTTSFNYTTYSYLPFKVDDHRQNEVKRLDEIGKPYTKITAYNTYEALANIVRVFYDEQYNALYGDTNDYVSTLDKYFENEFKSINNEDYYRGNSNGNVPFLNIYNSEQVTLGNANTLKGVTFDKLAKFMKDCWAALTPKTDIVFIIGYQDVKRKLNLLKRTFGKLPQQAPQPFMSKLPTKYIGSSITPKYDEIYHMPILGKVIYFVLDNPSISDLYAYTWIEKNVSISNVFHLPGGAFRVVLFIGFEYAAPIENLSREGIIDFIQPSTDSLRYYDQLGHTRHMLAAIFRYGPKDGEYPPCHRQLLSGALNFARTLTKAINSGSYMISIPLYDYEETLAKALAKLVNDRDTDEQTMPAPFDYVMYGIHKPDLVSGGNEYGKFVTDLYDSGLVYRFDDYPVQNSVVYIGTNTSDNVALTTAIRQNLPNVKINVLYLTIS